MYAVVKAPVCFGKISGSVPGGNNKRKEKIFVFSPTVSVCTLSTVLSIEYVGREL